LYLLAVGVNQLEHLKGNRLDYAAQDASDMVKLMEANDSGYMLFALKGQQHTSPGQRPG